MNLKAIKSIRIVRKCTRRQALKFVEKHINLLNSTYPQGFDNEEKTYFVLPGFENTTKNQPIIKFNPGEGKWELHTTSPYITIKHKQ